MFTAEYRLPCGSPSINKGNPSPSIIPPDSLDLDDDDDLDEPTPALDLAKRWVGLIVDQGAFERTHVPTCAADVTPYPCPDGMVNVNDLLHVINNWGPCPSAPVECPADIKGNNTPIPDGTVNVNDLLAVINAWGPCPGFSGSAGRLTSVQDCMDKCSEGYTPHSAEWNLCVNKCVAGLCGAGVLTPAECP